MTDEREEIYLDRSTGVAAGLVPVTGELEVAQRIRSGLRELDDRISDIERQKRESTDEDMKRALISRIQSLFADKQRSLLEILEDAWHTRQLVCTEDAAELRDRYQRMSELIANSQRRNTEQMNEECNRLLNEPLPGILRRTSMYRAMSNRNLSQMMDMFIGELNHLFDESSKVLNHLKRGNSETMCVECEMPNEERIPVLIDEPPKARLNEIRRKIDRYLNDRKSCLMDYSIVTTDGFLIDDSRSLNIELQRHINKEGMLTKDSVLLRVQKWDESLEQRPIDDSDPEMKTEDGTEPSRRWTVDIPSMTDIVTFEEERKEKETELAEPSMMKAVKQLSLERKVSIVPEIRDEEECVVIANLCLPGLSIVTHKLVIDKPPDSSLSLLKDEILEKFDELEDEKMDSDEIIIKHCLDEEDEISVADSIELVENIELHLDEQKEDDDDDNDDQHHFKVNVYSARYMSDEHLITRGAHAKGADDHHSNPAMMMKMTEKPRFKVRSCDEDIIYVLLYKEPLSSKKSWMYALRPFIPGKESLEDMSVPIFPFESIDDKNGVYICQIQLSKMIEYGESILMPMTLVISKDKWDALTQKSHRILKKDSSVSFSSYSSSISNVLVSTNCLPPLESFGGWNIPKKYSNVYVIDFNTFGMISGLISNKSGYLIARLKSLMIYCVKSIMNDSMPCMVACLFVQSYVKYCVDHCQINADEMKENVRLLLEELVFIKYLGTPKDSLDCKGLLLLLFGMMSMILVFREKDDDDDDDDNDGTPGETHLISANKRKLQRSKSSLSKNSIHINLIKERSVKFGYLLQIFKRMVQSSKLGNPYDIIELLYHCMKGSNFIDWMVDDLIDKLTLNGVHSHEQLWCLPWFNLLYIIDQFGHINNNSKYNDSDDMDARNKGVWNQRTIALKQGLKTVEELRCLIQAIEYDLFFFKDLISVFDHNNTRLIPVESFGIESIIVYSSDDYKTKMKFLKSISNCISDDNQFAKMIQRAEIYKHIESCPRSVCLLARLVYDRYKKKLKNTMTKKKKRKEISDDDDDDGDHDDCDQEMKMTAVDESVIDNCANMFAHLLLSHDEWNEITQSTLKFLMDYPIFVSDYTGIALVQCSNLIVQNEVIEWLMNHPRNLLTSMRNDSDWPLLQKLMVRSWCQSDSLLLSQIYHRCEQLGLDWAILGEICMTEGRLSDESAIEWLLKEHPTAVTSFIHNQVSLSAQTMFDRLVWMEPSVIAELLNAIIRDRKMESVDETNPSKCAVRAVIKCALCHSVKNHHDTVALPLFQQYPSLFD